ncbi:MAG: class I SAM-dependent methyltransferase [Deltaproteobacteria bacterium]|nr:class I SAM-dependent methyltransferase [Deltaproteobacteria bacterium]
MKKEKSSKTAVQMALSRTIESLKKEEERICDDPLAKDFLTPKYKILIQNKLLRNSVVKIIDQLFIGHHYYVVARTRYIDDFLQECIANEIQQVVIMGAGFDSRAYRFDYLKEITVFEVDHPATMSKKKEKIQKILGSLPNHVVYVPIDFLKEKLSDKLVQCGYNRKLKSLFIWEGTTPYLNPESVDDTLACISSYSGKGSSIIFDYILKSVLDKTCKYKGAKREFAYMKKTSEPFTFGIEEYKIIPFMEERKFNNIVSVGSDDLKKIYLKNDKTMVIKEWWRIVHANVI